MTRARTYAWLIAALFAGTTHTAHAFSDLEHFEQPADLGGGGGRYFTGAPVDGLSCVVCHEGGQPPAVRVRGLPLRGYRPNETYEIEISWADTDPPYALHLEAIDENGSEAGLIAPVAPGSVDERGRCNGDPRARVATSLLEREGRRILVVEACGARSTRFQLTPSTSSNIYLSAGIVASDKSARPSGDGASELRYVFTREGAAQEIRGVSCGVRAGRGPEHGLFWSALAVMLALGYRLARARG